ncbi:MAG: hypothetical protein K2H90_01380 [Oscillospiraceae bacterium]|nr:hypothetical protein [Oscillospiraceae bacterium]
MDQSKKPLWKKSMLKSLNFYEIVEFLDEIGNNGDPYGYEREESGYYQEYKEQFDDLSDGAYRLWDALDNSDYSDYSLRDIWDDMTVALLGYQEKVLGFDQVEEDYFAMLSYLEDAAVQEAEKRLMRFTKEQLIRNFRKVLTTLVLFFDIKAAHDCLTSIVEELDERGAILERKNEKINRLYEELTGSNAKDFDEIIQGIPPRMWVE